MDAKDAIEIPEGEPPMRPISKIEFIELLGRVQFYIGEDIVVEEDDAAALACSVLAAYAIEHMNDRDFDPESPMWKEFP